MGAHCGHAPASGLPAPAIGLQTRLSGDADDAVADVHLVAAAIDRLMPEGDAWLLDQPGAQQDAIAGHADDVALQATEVGEEDLDGLLLALGPAFGDPFVPVGDFLGGVRKTGIRRAEGIGPDAHEIGPPVRRRGGELCPPRDLVDAGRLTRDLAIIAECKGHLRLGHDRWTHQRLSGADRKHQGAEVVNAVELRLIAPQHLIDREGPGCEATLRAIGQRRLPKLVGTSRLQPVAMLVTRPRRLQRLERRRAFAANHLW